MAFSFCKAQRGGRSAHRRAEGWEGTHKSKYDATADTDRLIVDRVAALAEKHGVLRAQIAIAWLLQKEPVSSPIIGAAKCPVSRMQHPLFRLR